MVTDEKKSGKDSNSEIIGFLGWGALAHGLAFWFRKMPRVRFAAAGRTKLIRETFLARASAAEASMPVTVEAVPLDQWNLALLCTRAPDLMSAARQWLPQLPAGIPVGVLSNGRIENELLILRAEFPQFLWRRGLVYFGAREEDDGWLISGGAKILYGAIDPYAAFDRNAETPLEKRLCSELKEDGFLWVDDPHRVAREKWWLNTVLNTLCARWGLRENRHAMRHAEALKELGREAYALGEELDGVWPQPLSYYETTLHALIQSTAANENSLARAMRLQLPHENDFLGGAVKHAKGHYPLLREYVAAIDKNSIRI